MVSAGSKASWRGETVEGSGTFRCRSTRIGAAVLGTMGTELVKNPVGQNHSTLPLVQFLRKEGSYLQPTFLF